MAELTGGTSEQCREEMLDLVAGQRDHAWWRGMPITLGGCGDGQEGVRGHGQGDPAIPGGPAAELVLVQADQALAVWKRSSICQPQCTHEC
jgi:hypothetical protein